MYDFLCLESHNLIHYMIKGSDHGGVQGSIYQVNIYIFQNITP